MNYKEISQNGTCFHNKNMKRIIRIETINIKSQPDYIVTWPKL